ncbi:MAG: hypothetical protein AAGU12_02305 [Clostridiales bacterium]
MLSAAHWLFLSVVVIVIVTMAFRKDVVIPCALGLFLMGWLVKGSFTAAIQTVFTGMVAAGSEFIGIIIVISLIVAMSKALCDCGADYLMIQPATKLMVNADLAYWILGIVIMVLSWMIWPGPAVALIGAIVLPVAIKAGLPAIGAATVMTMFGYGCGLGFDWVIQGAPSISAKAAGLESAAAVTMAGIPLHLVMGLVATGTAYFMLKRDMKKDINKLHALHENNEMCKIEVRENISPFAHFIALFVPVAFVLNVVLMLKLDLKGGDATALVGGTALLIMCITAIGHHKLEALEIATDYVRQGFMFGIKVFAPVIVIAAFFFVGGEEMSKVILGPEGSGYMVDFARLISNSIPLSKFPVGLIVMGVGFLVGMDGSGFAPLPLTGAMAGSLGATIGADPAVLAAMGQITSVWTGGSVIVPWALIPVAAIVGVNPIEVARRCLIPVMAGYLATLILGVFLM